jgi:hypothetical protein
MQSLKIKEIQADTKKLTSALKSKEWTLITQKGNPIGMTMPFNTDVINNGLKTSLMINAFKLGFLSLGQFSKELKISQKKAMNILSLMNIDVIDYEFSKDMDTIKKYYDS